MRVLRAALSLKYKNLVPAAWSARAAQARGQRKKRARSARPQIAWTITLREIYTIFLGGCFKLWPRRVTPVYSLSPSLFKHWCWNTGCRLKKKCLGVQSGASSTSSQFCVFSKSGCDECDAISSTISVSAKHEQIKSQQGRSQKARECAA